MSILKNSNMRYKFNFRAFTTIITFIILSWICLYHNDLEIINKFLENGSKNITSFDITTYRLLAKHAYKSEVHRTKLQNNTRDDAYNCKLMNVKGNNKMYEQLKQDKSNNIDKFLKSYKSRHAKKKGLSKLDCYYENKIFKKIDYIYNIPDNWNKDKKSFKKMILNKYGIYIFFILLPLLGLIFPVLFGKIFGSTPILELCDKTGTEHSPCDKVHMTQTQCYLGEYLNAVTFIFMGIINILVIIYILIKIIKYEKIKAGKVKMNIKEYCRFCKDIF